MNEINFCEDCVMKVKLWHAEVALCPWTFAVIQE